MHCICQPGKMTWASSSFFSLTHILRFSHKLPWKKQGLVGLSELDQDHQLKVVFSNLNCPSKYNKKKCKKLLLFGRLISTFHLGHPKVMHYAIVKISVHLYLTLLYLFKWIILHSNFHNQDCIFLPMGVKMDVFVDLCFFFTPNCVLWHWQWSFENSIIYYIYYI